MIIVAINGKAQSGKGTFSKELRKLWKQKIKTPSREINFADTLKDACHVIFNIPYPDMYSSSGKDKKLYNFGNVSVRQILQRVGTEVCRTIYENIWVWNVEQKIKRAENEKIDLVVVTDLRFLNEYKYLEKRNSIFIKIVRPGYKINESYHVSENDLDDSIFWDYISETDSLGVLKQNAKIFFESIIMQRGRDA